MKKLVVFMIDALCTLDIDYIKNLPNFKFMFEKGSMVKHVEPIYPTLTYPCHVSILTGVSSKTHGIPHNEMVDIEDANAPWYSLSSQIKVPTVMDLFKAKGLSTCSLTWPVSGGANIDYNMPMIIPISYQGDNPLQFYENYSSKEIIDKYWWKYSHYLTGENRSLDEFTMHLALDIIEDYKQPDVMLIKMCDLDTVKHNHGVDNDLVKKQLRLHDQQFGLIVEAIKRYGNFEDTNFIILGDHGQQDIARSMNFNLLLKENGFIKTDENNNLVDWDAYCHSAVMSAWIQLKNPNDEALRQRVYEFLLKVKANPEYHIGYVFTKEEVDQMFNLRENIIDFVIEGEDGFPLAFDSTLAGKDLFEKYLVHGNFYSKASHGYLPFKDETTTFIACGKNIKEGIVIERSSMLNEASTLAKIMGYDMENTEGSPWTEILK